MQTKPQTQHTPGPWKIRSIGVNGSQTVYAMRNDVATAYDRAPMVKGECEANAQLIAAAPELLEALQEALAWCEIDATDEDGFPSQEMLENRVEILREAIAKATGGAP
jgi:hypothetical protein